MARDGEVFVGRHDVLRLLAEELSSATGGPRLVWLEGESGIGKTSVLRTALSDAPERRTIWAWGVEEERELSFSVIDQLGRGLAALSGRPTPFSAGVRAGADPLAVGADLLVSIGDSPVPVVLVVDDLQWVDEESARALLFALRRLQTEPLLVIVTSHPHTLARLPSWMRLLGDASRCRRVELSGLRSPELIDLAQAVGAGPLDADTAERLLQHTAGHPLHARALLTEFGVRGLIDADGILPAPRALATLMVARLGGLPPAARQLVEAGAVLGRSSRLPDVALIAELRDPLPATDAAIAAGLLEWSPSGEVQFPHPLLRAAVYNDMSLTRRRALHLAAAATASDEAALDHRAAAAYEYDAELAGELEAVAARDAAGGRTSLAARRLRQAAALSAGAQDRDRRVLMATEVLFGAGMMAAGRMLADDVRACRESAYRSFVLGCIAFAEGRVADGESLVTAAAEQPDGPGDLAARAAAAAGTARMLMGRWEGAVAACTAALAGDAGWAAGIARYTLAVCNVRLGRFDELDELRRRVIGEMAASRLPRLEALGVIGAIKYFSDDLDDAAADLAQVAELARAGERTRLLVAALAAHAEVSFRLGRWEDAIVASELAASLAQDTEQIVGLQQAHAMAAVVHARRGRFDLAQPHLDSLGATESLLHWWGESALVATSRAVFAEARGDHDAMYQAIAPLIRPTDELGWRLAQWPWIVVAVDALIGVGRVDTARAELDELATVIARRHLTSPAVDLARLRGRLAEADGDLEQAERHYRAGADARDGLPYGRGRVLLAYGRLLRRMGRRGDAVDQLRRARAELAALGATPDVGACDEELASCGEVVPTRTEDHVRLTPAELSVAHLVAQGLSNREVAARLYVSSKTVEYHLGHIFAKLHITSRRQLRGTFPPGRDESSSSTGT